MGHSLRSSGLLHVKASRARVFQYGLKTYGGAAWMVHVASLWRWRRVKAENRRVNAMGCVGPFYPNFAVFFVFGPGGILVFYSFAYAYK
jgi:hypothetical protein